MRWFAYDNWSLANMYVAADCWRIYYTIVFDHYIVADMDWKKCHSLENNVKRKRKVIKIRIFCFFLLLLPSFSVFFLGLSFHTLSLSLDFFPDQTRLIVVMYFYACRKQKKNCFFFPFFMFTVCLTAFFCLLLFHLLLNF